MKKQILIASVLASSLMSTNLFAQSQNEQVEKLEEIVVTATKFNLKKENSGKVITKITSEQLKNNTGKKNLGFVEPLNEGRRHIRST